jgi:predicted amidohydrolase
MHRLVSSLSFFMKITIIQPETIWEDKASNFYKIEQIIGNLSEASDIIVLPEMFTTGFTLNAEKLAEEFNGETLKWMSDLSLKGNFAICGSFIIRLAGEFYNRFSFVTPENKCLYYDKRHLFSLGGENEVYSCGKIRHVINYNSFRILPIVCYDLRFPVWCRNRGDYDILICVASWPDVRREAWNSLLKARAIENQCYVVGVNRVGTDNEGVNHAGESVVLNPLGWILGKVDEYTEGSATVDISMSELQHFREKFPFWKDSDDYSINI